MNKDEKEKFIEISELEPGSTEGFRLSGPYRRADFPWGQPVHWRNEYYLHSPLKKWHEDWQIALGFSVRITQPEKESESQPDVFYITTDHRPGYVVYCRVLDEAVDWGARMIRMLEAGRHFDSSGGFQHWTYDKEEETS